MIFGSLFGALEGPDLVIILVIVLVLFGGAKLPQLARSLGQAKREFEAGLDSRASPTAPATTDDTVTTSPQHRDPRPTESHTTSPVADAGERPSSP